MSPERNRQKSKEQKPTFSDSFNSLKDKILAQLEKTEFTLFPMVQFDGGSRALFLHKDGSWTKYILGESRTLTSLPEYVLRAYVTLTRPELYSRIVKLKGKRAKIASEVDSMAAAILENNREEIEARFLSYMRSALRLARQLPKKS